MFCNHCGASNADGSRFCTDCGESITSSTPGKKPAPITAETEYGLPIGAVLANRYRILGALGMGGMGRVYLAEDQKLETRVAIKVLREVLSRDPGSVKRLIEEAKHSMTLAHPNVVRIHNFEDGELVKFLIMEYVEGETLAELKIVLPGKGQGLSREETVTAAPLPLLRRDTSDLPPQSWSFVPITMKKSHRREIAETVELDF